MLLPAQEGHGAAEPRGDFQGAQGMEQLCWGENLTGMGLFSLEEPQGDPIVASQDLKEPTGKMERDP